MSVMEQKTGAGTNLHLYGISNQLRACNEGHSSYGSSCQRLHSYNSKHQHVASHPPTTLPVIDISSLALKEEEECNPPKTRVPRGRPKKKREERATYRSTRGLRAEDVEQGSDGEAVIGDNRLVVRRRNLCSTCVRAL